LVYQTVVGPTEAHKALPSLEGGFGKILNEDVAGSARRPKKHVSNE